MSEVEPRIHHSDANARASPTEGAGGGTNPLHTRRNNLRACRSVRSGDLSRIRIGRISARVESANAIRIGCLTLEPQIAQGGDAGSDLCDLGKAAAACHGPCAALNQESGFIVGIVRPTQGYLAVRR